MACGVLSISIQTDSKSCLDLVAVDLHLQVAQRTGRSTALRYEKAALDESAWNARQKHNTHIR